MLKTRGIFNMANRAYDLLVKTGWHFNGDTWVKDGEEPQNEMGALARELEKHVEFLDLVMSDGSNRVVMGSRL